MGTVEHVLPAVRGEGQEGIIELTEVVEGAPEYEPLTDRERTFYIWFAVACMAVLLLLFFVVMILGHSPAFS